MQPDDVPPPLDVEAGKPAGPLELADLHVDREKEERLERERAVREREDRKRLQVVDALFADMTLLLLACCWGKMKLL